MLNYEIKSGDLFSVDKSYTLVHCISADFKMGAGIATVFAKMGVRNKLYLKYPDYGLSFIHGDCIYVETTSYNVMNLITKKYYYEKPTYKSITEALECLKVKCAQLGITKLAMPKIGCGLDQLKWEKVEKIILSTFNDTDLDIVIYMY